MRRLIRFWRLFLLVAPALALGQGMPSLSPGSPLGTGDITITDANGSCTISLVSGPKMTVGCPFQFGSAISATGATNIDFSGSSGTFLTPTGVNTFGGSSNSFTNAVQTASTAINQFACTGAAACYLEAASGQALVFSPNAGSGGINMQLLTTGDMRLNSTSGTQYNCTGAATCGLVAANAQDINLQTSGGGKVKANGTAVVTSSDWTWNVYDPVTVVGTTGNIAQVGPVTNAGTLRDFTFVAPIAGGGTGTETIKLSTTSGCGSNVLGTLSIACNGAANSITTGTVNSSAVAASSTLFVCITGACTTADIQGNVSAHFTTP